MSKYQPGAVAMHTDEKANLIDHGRTEVEVRIADMLMRRTGEFSAGIICAPFQLLCSRLSLIVGSPVHRATLLRALQESNWVDCGRIMSRTNTTKKQIFATRELRAQLTNVELRDLAENGIDSLPEVKALLDKIAKA